jgi:hypothetical protein
MLLLAAILRTGVKTGKREFFAVLRMTFRTVAQYSLVPGTGPT